MINRTVGSTGDHANWDAAQTWLASQSNPLTDDYTFTQISDTTESCSFSTTYNHDFGGYTVTFTSDTPHYGRPDKGWQILRTGAANQNFLVNRFTNGKLVISNLRIEAGVASWQRALYVLPDTDFEVEVHDVIAYGSDSYSSAAGYTYGVIDVRPYSNSSVKMWNVIADAYSSGHVTSFYMTTNVTSPTVEIENCTFQTRGNGFYTASVKESTVLCTRSYRNVFASRRDGTSGYCFETASPAPGYSCASTDSSVSTYLSTGTNYYNVSLSTNLSSSLLADAFGWMVPADGSLLYINGATTQITANTYGVRGASRPTSGDYSIGAVQAQDDESYTVGSGGDYSTWQAAMTAANNLAPFGGDVTFTQISNVTETGTAAIAGSTDFGSWTLKFTSDTSHGGRPDQGWQTNHPIASGAIFDVGGGTGVKNGTVEIEKLRVVITGASASLVYADAGQNMSIKIHDLIVYSSSTQTDSNGIVKSNARDSTGQCHIWNVICDVPAVSATTCCIAVSTPTSGSSVIVENSIGSIQGAQYSRPFFMSGTANGIISIRNCVGAYTHSSGAAFDSFGIGSTYGYNNAATDTSTSSFNTVGPTQYPSITLATEFNGSDYSTPATYFVPDDNEQLAYGGYVVEISDNSAGIRGGTRIPPTNPSYITPATISSDHQSIFSLEVSNAVGDASSSAYLLLTGEPDPGAGSTSPNRPTVNDIALVDDTIELKVEAPTGGADTYRASLYSEDSTEVTYAQRDGEGTISLTVPSKGTRYHLVVVAGNYGSPAVWSYPGYISSIYIPALASQSSQSSTSTDISDEAKAAGPLGVGISFPFRFSSSTGAPEISYDIEHVKESMRQIIGTVVHQRFMRRDFGTQLSASLFKLLPDVELEVMPAVVAALNKWERRITLNDIEIDTDSSKGVVTLNVSFTINRTYTEGNLVYPLYLEVEQ